jgi:hypothetical protein
MDKQEIKKEMGMTYSELVEYLVNKYGRATGNYFLNESCKSKNAKITRTKEGLYCHHIDEDKAIMLCNDKFAKDNPYDYQKADRLVYCNVLEHLLLHIKIIEEPKNEQANELEIQGLGGVVKFICPELNDRYNGEEPTQEWRVNVFNQVRDNFEDYIDILNYFLDVINKTPFKEVINKTTLSQGFYSGKIDKIYKMLK